MLFIVHKKILFGVDYLNTEYSIIKGKIDAKLNDAFKKIHKTNIRITWEFIQKSMEFLGFTIKQRVSVC